MVRIVDPARLCTTQAACNLNLQNPHAAQGLIILAQHFQKSWAII